MEYSEDPIGILYVGDLNSSVTEKNLFEKFKDYGEILSIRVCRDIKTKKSLGYAYVNFKIKSEAKMAKDALNLSCIHGQPCRVMWYDKDPSKRKSGVGNIVIKNIDGYTSVREINDVFSNFGKITSCKLKTDEAGLSAGCAFVNYNNEEDAESAIEAMDQNVLGENVITVEKFYTKKSSSKDHLRSCFVDNCSDSLDDDLLRSMFEKYGPVVTAKMMLNDRGVSRGFGFVSFKEVDDAVRAVTDLDGRMVEKRRLHVYRVVKRKEGGSVNLYVNNLSSKVDDLSLKRQFEQFGKVVSAKVMLEPGGHKSLCYGFVSYSSREHAHAAILAMHGKLHLGKKMYVALNKTDSQDLPAPPTQPPIPIFGYQNLVRPIYQYPVTMQAPFMWPPGGTAMGPFGPPMSQPVNSFKQQQQQHYSGTVGPGTVKKMFLERLYPMVSKYATFKAGQIMAKLADLDNEHLSGMIDNQQLLVATIMKIADDLRDTTQANIGTHSITDSTQNSNDSGVKNEELESSFDEESSDEFFSEDESLLEAKSALGKLGTPFVNRNAQNVMIEIMDTLLKLDTVELLYKMAKEEYLKANDPGLRAPGLHEKAISADGNIRMKKNFLVEKKAGDMAEEITDMFLLSEVPELQIENEDSLRVRVEDTLGVLQDVQAARKETRERMDVAAEVSLQEDTEFRSRARQPIQTFHRLHRSMIKSASVSPP